MTILYSCRHDGDQFRISKFDEHGEVLSSYLCDEQNCECPAGHRRMCRHREMLPLFIRRNAVNSGWWLDYDRGGWVQMFDETPAMTSEGAELTIETIITLPNDSTSEMVAEAFANIMSEARTTPADTFPSGSELPIDPMPPLPEGVQMFDIDNILGIHNAIAEAVGEPEAMIPDPYTITPEMIADATEYIDRNPSLAPVPTPRKSWRRF